MFSERLAPTTVVSDSLNFHGPVVPGDISILSHFRTRGSVSRLLVGSQIETALIDSFRGKVSLVEPEKELKTPPF